MIYKQTSHKLLGYGIYDMSEVEYLGINGAPQDLENAKAEDITPELQAFIDKYPNFVLASAYETGATFLLSSEPPRWSGKRMGSGFNHGSTNVLVGCTNKLLILAEND